MNNPTPRDSAQLPPQCAVADGLNIFYEGRFDGESEEWQKQRFKWAGQLQSAQDAMRAQAASVEPVGYVSHRDHSGTVIWNAEPPPPGSYIYSTPPASDARSPKFVVEALPVAGHVSINGHIHPVKPWAFSPAPTPADVALCKVSDIMTLLGMCRQYETTDERAALVAVKAACAPQPQAVAASSPATADALCSPTLTECPRCRNDISKCDGVFKQHPASSPPTAEGAVVLTDQQIVGFLESAGVKFQSFMGGIGGTKHIHCTSGSQDVSKIVAGFRAALQASRQPHAPQAVDAVVHITDDEIVELFQLGPFPEAGDYILQGRALLALAETRRAQADVSQPETQQAGGEGAGDALSIATDALEEIALAGMSGTGQESDEAMTEWHARQAWKFIGIAARAKSAIAALATKEQP